MHHLKYIVYHEDKYYVSQCLNVDVSSFGDTIDEAINNLKEAMELYLADAKNEEEFHEIGDTLIGDAVVNA